MTDAGLAVSDRFAFRSLGAVASLDDFGHYADSAFALARSTFGHADSEVDIVRHMIGDDVALATDPRNDTVAEMTILSMSTAAESAQTQIQRHDHIEPDAAVAHLQGTVTDPDTRGLGLYRELNRRRFEQILDRNIRFVTTTTQNPKVERGVLSTLDELVAQDRIPSKQRAAAQNNKDSAIRYPLANGTDAIAHASRNVRASGRRWNRVLEPSRPCARSSAPRREPFDLVRP